MRSGELAKLAGVSSDTLRHYERKGVLAAPRRLANGYRAYTMQTLERVRLIRRALAVGFTLDELALIFKERGRGRAPCRQVREMAAAKLVEVETRLSEMLRLRDELRATLRAWDAKLAKTRDGEPATLLEALAESETLSGPQPSTQPLSWKQKRRGVKQK